MRILFLSPWYPHPPTNGSKIRIGNLLRGLAARHRVELLSFVREGEAHDPEVLRGVCASVEAVPWREYRSRSARALAGLFLPVPRSVLDTYSAEMAGAIARRARECDCVVASEWPMLAYGAAWGDKPALVDDVEIAAIYEAGDTGGAARLRRRLTRAKMDTYLRRSTAHFRAFTVVSEQERTLLAGAIGTRRPIEIIPNCVDYAQYRDVAAPRADGLLVFTGSLAFAPNRDAVAWFLREAFPLVRRAYPAARLDVTGKYEDDSLTPEMRGDGVRLLGHVPDVRAVIAGATVSIAPIRAGGGTRLKILEAMALGTPVVATSKGIEGLDARDGAHVLVADRPQAFAEQVTRLLGDAALRRRLADNARALVAERYDWAAVMPRFLDLVERVAQLAR